MCNSNDTPTAYHPSLNGLPTVLKQRVLQHLATVFDEEESNTDDDEAGDGHGHSHSHEGHDHAEGEDCDDEHEHGGGCCGGDELGGAEKAQREYKATLGALGRVNKEWFGLVAPEFWRELYLFPYSTEAILDLVIEILPRRGDLVQKLLFQESPFVPLLESNTDEDIKPEGRALAIVEAAERFVNADAKLGWEQRALRSRDLLLAQVVKGCKNVDSLDIDGPVRPLTLTDDDEPIAIPEEVVPSTAMQALKDLGPKIKHLNLLLPPDGISSERDAADFLTAFSNLRTLELNSFPCPVEDATQRKADRKALLDSLADLKHLEELDLGQSDFIDDSFAQLPLAAPLQKLAMDSMDELSFEGFITLVEKFSETLTSLELDGTPHDDDEDETAKFVGKALNLPKLVKLEISTPHKAKFLEAFVNSPLEEVDLGIIPNMTPSEIVEFLKTHVKTLKTVVVEDEGIPDAEEIEEGEEEAASAVEVIVTWCEEKGIKYLIEESRGLDFGEEDEEWEDEQ